MTVINILLALAITWCTIKVLSNTFVALDTAPPDNIQQAAVQAARKAGTFNPWVQLIIYGLIGAACTAILFFV